MKRFFYKATALLLTLSMMLLPTAFAAEGEETLITLSGQNATVSGTGATVLGTVITLTSGGVYRISGEGRDLTLTVDAPDAEVEIKLDDVTLQNTSEPALKAESANKLTVKAVKGSVNVLTVGEAGDVLAGEPDEEASGAVIKTSCDLKLEGKGTLFVGGYIHNGIHTKKDLKIDEIQLTVHAADHALRGDNSVTLAGGTLELVSGGDAVSVKETEKENKGFILISGGSLSIRSNGDGISATRDLSVTGGEIGIQTGGGSASVTRKTSDSFGRGFPMQWDDYDTDNEDTTSAKGLKSKGTLTVSGGILTLDTADDAFHATGELVIRGGKMDLKSGDDGIHSDLSVTVEGGTVTVADSYEGIEAPVITVTGGDLDINADDDGFNACGGEDQFSGFGGGRGNRGNWDRNRDPGTSFDKASFDKTTETPNGSERPELPEGAEPSQMPQMPEGAEPPQMPQMPDGAEPPQMPQMPEGAEPPQMPQLPEGAEPPQMPETPEWTDQPTSPESSESTETSDPLLTISGGSIHVNAGGDGLDSNKDLIISGGTVIVDGPSDSGNSALDGGSENSGALLIHGGTVLAIGDAGMAESFGSASTQASVFARITFRAGDRIRIADADGSILMEHTALKSGSCVIFSAPEVQDGEILTVSVNEGSVTVTASIGSDFGSQGFGGFGHPRR